MKIKILIILIISFCKVSFSQNIEWNIYDVDSIVSVEMPYDVFEIDTIQDYKRIYQIFSSIDSVEFRVQKIYLGKIYSNIETIKLPHDEISLEKLYSDMIWAATEINNYNFSSSKPIIISNLKGYNLIFNNNEGLPIHELYLFIVNNNLYTFSYLNSMDFNEIERNLFFNSIFFNSEKELWQYPKKPFFTIKKIIFILFIFLVISFFLRIKSQRIRNV